MTTSNALVAIDNKVDDTLKHYGVKGMKWGKKKAQQDDGSVGITITTVNRTKLTEEDEAILDGPPEAAQKLVDEYKKIAVESLKKEKRGEKAKPSAESAYTLYERAATRFAEAEKKRKDTAFRNQQAVNVERTRVKARYGDAEAARNGKGTSYSDKPVFKSDITTAELLERRKKRRRNAAQHDEMDLDDYLMHYGVKGMKWGVRKDKRGAVKSVAKRTPLRGKNEKGPVRDFLNANDHGGTKNHKAVSRAYKTARPYIKQGLREINKDERYRDKDLTNEKSKLVKQYHKDVSDMVTSKLNMAAVVKAKRGDKLVPAMDYQLGKSNEPQIRELNSHNQFKDRGTKRAAKIELEKHMNVGDAVIQVGKGLAKNAAVYAAASQVVGAGIVAATGLELIFPEYSNPITRSISGYDGPIEYTGPPRRVRHSDGEESGLTIVFDPIMDETGHISDVTFDVVSDSSIGHADLLSVKMKDISQNCLAHYQAADDLDDYLMHYGVKGMKWGRRKDGKPQGYQGGGGSKSKSKKSSDGLSDRLSKMSSATKTKIRKAADPKRRAKKKIERTKRKAEVAEAKAEAKARVAEAEKKAAEAEKKAAEARKATELTRTATTDKSGSGSLSDKELKAVVERMNLEKQYAKHMSDAKPKKMSTTLMNIAKETAIDFAKQKVRSEINRTLGTHYDKLFKVAGAAKPKSNETPDPTPKQTPKNPFTFKTRTPKAPRTEAPSRSEPRTQSSPTRPTPPSYGPSQRALPSPPRPSQRALPGPGPSGPSSGGASARVNNNPTVLKFGKVSMDQIQAYKEGRPYKPFDPRRRR